MRRILIGCLSLLLCVPFQAQTDDPVLMTVNGKEIRKSEFEYFFNKNRTDEPVTPKTIKEYAQLYLNFKLKVEAAIDEGMDKSESFLNEFKTYRDMQAEDYVIDKAYLEDVARRTYESTKVSVGPEGLVYLTLISLEPDEKKGLGLDKCYQKLQEVHEALDAGADFVMVTQEKEFADLGVKSADVGWVTRTQVPEEVYDALFVLEPGQYSEAFVSRGVAFIVKAEACRDLGTYAENRDDIYEWMRGENSIYAEARRRVANKYADSLNWAVRNDSAVAYLDDVLEEVNTEFGNISREYHDGLLMFDISSREVWEKAVNDSLGRLAYFNSHRKQYKFDQPCFKGMVLFCLGEEIFHRVEDILKDTDMKDWVDSLVAFNKELLQVRVMKASAESDIFHQGENAYVDKIVFGKGEYEPMEYYSYVNVLGRVIKQPETIDDVASQVTEDYQNYLEKKWVDSLRKKYKYSINKKVLKQVCLDGE